MPSHYGGHRSSAGLREGSVYSLRQDPQKATDQEKKKLAQRSLLNRLLDVDLRDVNFNEDQAVAGLDSIKQSIRTSGPMGSDTIRQPTLPTMPTGQESSATPMYPRAPGLPPGSPTDQPGGDHDLISAMAYSALRVPGGIIEGVGGVLSAIGSLASKGNVFSGQDVIFGGMDKAGKFVTGVGEKMKSPFPMSESFAKKSAGEQLRDPIRLLAERGPEELLPFAIPVLGAASKGRKASKIAGALDKAEVDRAATKALGGAPGDDKVKELASTLAKTAKSAKRWKRAGPAIMGVRAYGLTFNEARKRNLENGMPPEEADTRAFFESAVVGSAEFATEHLMTGVFLSKLAPWASKVFMRESAKKMSDLGRGAQVRHVLGQVSLGTTTEALEEITQEAIGATAARLIGKDPEAFEEFAAQLGQAALLGGTMGGGMSALMVRGDQELDPQMTQDQMMDAFRERVNEIYIESVQKGQWPDGTPIDQNEADVPEVQDGATPLEPEQIFTEGPGLEPEAETAPEAEEHPVISFPPEGEGLLIPPTEAVPPAGAEQVSTVPQPMMPDVSEPGPVVETAGPGLQPEGQALETDETLFAEPEPDVDFETEVEEETQPWQIKQARVVATGSSVPANFPAENRRVKANWAVVELDDLVASHDPETFVKSPESDFPSQIQGRAYHGDAGKDARNMTISRSSNPDVGLMVDPSSNVAVGPATITPSGVVVAGNERTMIAKRMYASVPERANEYRQAVMSQASKFGMGADAVTAIEQSEKPVIVRMMTGSDVDLSDPMVLQSLNRESDVPTGKAKDVLSDANTRARVLMSKQGLLQTLAEGVDDTTTLNKFLATPGGRSFMNEMVADGVIYPTESAAFVDKFGYANVEGRKLVEQVMKLAALGGTDAVQTYPAALLNKLSTSFAYMASARAAGKEWDLAPLLAEAANITQIARDTNTKIEDVGYSQITLSGEQHHPSAVQMAIYLRDTPKHQVRLAMNKWADGSRVDPNQMDMLSGMGAGAERLTPDQQLERLFGVKHGIDPGKMDWLAQPEVEEVPDNAVAKKPPDKETIREEPQKTPKEEPEGKKVSTDKKPKSNEEKKDARDTLKNLLPRDIESSSATAIDRVIEPDYYRRTPSIAQFRDAADVISELGLEGKELQDAVNALDSLAKEWIRSANESGLYTEGRLKTAEGSLKRALKIKPFEEILDDARKFVSDSIEGKAHFNPSVSRILAGSYSDEDLSDSTPYMAGSDSKKRYKYLKLLFRHNQRNKGDLDAVQKVVLDRIIKGGKIGVDDFDIKRAMRESGHRDKFPLMEGFIKNLLDIGEVKKIRSRFYAKDQIKPEAKSEEDLKKEEKLDVDPSEYHKSVRDFEGSEGLKRARNLFRNLIELNPSKAKKWMTALQSNSPGIFMYEEAMRYAEERGDSRLIAAIQSIASRHHSRLAGRNRTVDNVKSMSNVFRSAKLGAEVPDEPVSQSGVKEVQDLDQDAYGRAVDSFSGSGGITEARNRIKEDLSPFGPLPSWARGLSKSFRKHVAPPIYFGKGVEYALEKNNPFFLAAVQKIARHTINFIEKRGEGTKQEQKYITQVSDEAKLDEKVPEVKSESKPETEQAEQSDSDDPVIKLATEQPGLTKAAFLREMGGNNAKNRKLLNNALNDGRLEARDHPKRSNWKAIHVGNLSAAQETEIATEEVSENEIAPTVMEEDEFKELRPVVETLIATGKVREAAAVEAAVVGHLTETAPPPNDLYDTEDAVAIFVALAVEGIESGRSAMAEAIDVINMAFMGQVPDTMQDSIEQWEAEKAELLESNPDDPWGGEEDWELGAQKAKGGKPAAKKKPASTRTLSKKELMRKYIEMSRDKAVAKGTTVMREVRKASVKRRAKNIERMSNEISSTLFKDPEFHFRDNLIMHSKISDKGISIRWRKKDGFVLTFDDGFQDLPTGIEANVIKKGDVPVGYSLKTPEVLGNLISVIHSNGMVVPAIVSKKSGPLELSLEELHAAVSVYKALEVPGAGVRIDMFEGSGKVARLSVGESRNGQLYYRADPNQRGQPYTAVTYNGVPRSLFLVANIIRRYPVWNKAKAWKRHQMARVINERILKGDGKAIAIGTDNGDVIMLGRPTYGKHKTSHFILREPDETEGSGKGPNPDSYRKIKDALTEAGFTGKISTKQVMKPEHLTALLAVANPKEPINLKSMFRKLTATEKRELLPDQYNPEDKGYEQTLPRRTYVPREDESEERKRQAKAVNESTVVTPFQSSIQRDEARSDHPTLLVEARANAGSPLPPLTQPITSPVVDELWGHEDPKKNLSDEQVEMVRRVKGAWSNEKGFLLAADVGVGKTRVFIASILEAVQDGAKNVVYVTKNEQLASDFQSEYEELTSGMSDSDKPDIVVLRDKEYGGKVPSPPSDRPVIYVVTSASSVKVPDWFNLLGDMGIDVLAADESHLYKNRTSNRAAAWAGFHEKLMARKAKIVYGSATPAVAVEELEYLYGLKEWAPGMFERYIEYIMGEGDRPPRTAEEADEEGDVDISKMEKADHLLPKVPASVVEQIVRELRAKGVMLSVDLARESTYDVHFMNIRQGAHNSDENVRKWNERARWMRDLLRLVHQSRPNDKGKFHKATERGFTQAIMKQLLFELKMPEIVTRAREEIAAGKQVVISIHNVSGETESVPRIPVQVVPEKSSSTDVHFELDVETDTGASGRVYRLADSHLWVSSLETPDNISKVDDAFKNIPRGDNKAEKDGVKAAEAIGKSDKQNIGVYKKAIEYAKEKENRLLEAALVHKAKILIQRLAEERGAASAFQTAVNKVFGYNIGKVSTSAMGIFPTLMEARKDVTNDLREWAHKNKIRPEWDASARASAAINMVQHEIFTSSQTEGREGEEIDDIEYGGIDPNIMRRRDALKNRWSKLGKLGDPIEMITDALGEDAAIITGGSTVNQRREAVASFQAGETRVAVISAAGKEGISLHDVNGKQRVMLIADYEWSAEVLKQELGRIDRTGQKSSPEMILMVSDFAGERRLAAQAQAGLRALGATSKGGADSTHTEALDAFDLRGKAWLDAFRIVWNADEPRGLTAEEREQFTSSRMVDKEGIPYQNLPDDAKQRIILADFLYMESGQAEVILQKWQNMAEPYLYDNPDVRPSHPDAGRILSHRDITSGMGVMNLTRVKTNRGDTYAIASGVLARHMRSIQFIRQSVSGRAVRPAVSYTQFTENNSGAVVAGLRLSNADADMLEEQFAKGPDSHKQVMYNLLDDSETSSNELGFSDSSRSASMLAENRPLKGDEVPYTEAEFADMIMGFLTDLGFYSPILYGRLKNRNWLGSFNVIGEQIRLKSRRDPETLVHEMGHALDKIVFGLADMFPKKGVKPKRGQNFTKEVRKELVEAGKKMYGDKKPLAFLVREGFAEFIRELVTEPDSLQENYPQATQWFYDTVLGKNTTLRLGLRELQEKYRLLASRTAVDRARIRSMSEQESHEKRKSEDRKTWRQRIAKQLWDVLQPLEDAIKELKKRNAIPEKDDPYRVMTAKRATAGATVHHMWTRGMVDRAGNRTGHPSMAEIVDKYNLNKRWVEFNQYLHALRAQAIYRAAQKRLPPGIEHKQIGPGEERVHKVGDGRKRLPPVPERKALPPGEERVHKLGDGRKRLPPVPERLALPPGDPEEAEELGFGGLIMNQREVRDPGMSKEEADALVAAYDHKSSKTYDPTFRKAAIEVHKWFDGVLGYISQASPTYAAIVERIRRYDPGNYVPLARHILPSEREGKKSSSLPHNLYKRKGSDRVVIHPLDVAQKAMTSLVQRSNVEQVMYNVEKLHMLEGSGKWIRSVPIDKVVAAVPSIREVLYKVRDRADQANARFWAAEQLKANPSRESLVSVSLKGAEEYLAAFLDLPITIWRPTKEDAPLILSRQQPDGSIRWYEIDKEVLDSLKPNWEPTSLPVKMVAGHTRYFKGMTTGTDLDFNMSVNPIRDLVHLFFTAETGEHGNKSVIPHKTIRSWIKILFKESPYATLGLFFGSGIGAIGLSSGIFGVLGGIISMASLGRISGSIAQRIINPRTGDLTALVQRLGLEHTGYAAQERKSYRRNLRKTLAKGNWHTRKGVKEKSARMRSMLSTYFDVIVESMQGLEQLPRLASVEIKLKELGLDITDPELVLTIEQSIQLANSFRGGAATDFTAGGRAIKKVDKWSPYTAARINSARHLVRGLGFQGPMIAATRLGSMTAAVALYMFLLYDEEDWEAVDEIPIGDKMRHIYLPLWSGISEGEEEMIRLPVPEQVWAFGYMTIHALRHLQKEVKDEDVARELAVGMLTSINPVGWPPLISNMPLASPIEATYNKNFFTRRPLVGRSLERLPESERYYPWTSETAKKLGPALGKTPAQLVFGKSPVEFEHVSQKLAGRSVYGALRGVEKVGGRALGLGLQGIGKDERRGLAETFGAGAVFQRGGKFSAAKVSTDKFFRRIEEMSQKGAIGRPHLDKERAQKVAIVGELSSWARLLRSTMNGMATALERGRGGQVRVPDGSGGSGYQQYTALPRTGGHIVLQRESVLQFIRSMTGEDNLSPFNARQRIMREMSKFQRSFIHDTRDYEEIDKATVKKYANMVKFWYKAGVESGAKTKRLMNTRPTGRFRVSPPSP